MTQNSRKEGYGSLSNSDPPNRNALARAAYQSGDVELSRDVHAKTAAEPHYNGGGHIKSAVYGGLDGIITTFATVTTVAGAQLSSSVILILGIAHLFADGISMGLGDYLSTKAEQDLMLQEKKREKWEVENSVDGEIKEMVDLYEAKKGMKREDANIIMKTFAKYPDAFVDFMMFEELQLNPYDDDDPAVGGVVTFCSFVIFGCVPLFSYLFALIPGVEMSDDAQLYISLILTAVTMFVLGALKGHFVGQLWWTAGASMMANGCAAAAAAWFIGHALSEAGIHDG